MQNMVETPYKSQVGNKWKKGEKLCSNGRICRVTGRPYTYTQLKEVCSDEVQDEDFSSSKSSGGEKSQAATKDSSRVMKNHHQ